MEPFGGVPIAFPASWERNSCMPPHSARVRTVSPAITTVPSICPPAMQASLSPRSIPIMTGGRPMYPRSSVPACIALMISGPEGKSVHVARMPRPASSPEPRSRNAVWYRVERWPILIVSPVMVHPTFLSTAPTASSTQESSGRSIPTGTSTIFSTIEARIGAQMIPDAPSFSARAAATMHSSREWAE